MLPVLYDCAKNKTFNKKELCKIFRANILNNITKIVFFKKFNIIFNQKIFKFFLDMLL